MKLDILNGLLKAVLSKRFHSSAQMEDNDMHMTKLGNLLRLLVAKADQPRACSDSRPFLAFLKAERLRSKHSFYSFMTHFIIHHLQTSGLNSADNRATSSLVLIGLR